MGVIKNKGRINNSTLNHERKIQFFILGGSRLVNLLIFHLHKSNMHCRLSQTLDEYRSIA